MQSVPGCSGKTGRSSQLDCMPRMKKQSAHAGLAVGVPLEAFTVHENQTAAMRFLIFCMDIAHHGPKRE
jgi:hypothetical protein